MLAFPENIQKSSKFWKSILNLVKKEEFKKYGNDKFKKFIYFYKHYERSIMLLFAIFVNVLNTGIVLLFAIFGYFYLFIIDIFGLF